VEVKVHQAFFNVGMIWRWKKPLGIDLGRYINKVKCKCCNKIVQRKQGWTELNGFIIIIIIIIIIIFLFIVIGIINVWRWALRIRLRSIYLQANVVPVLPPSKEVPERLLQDAWRFADPAWVWWRCSCRNGTTADGLVAFRYTHWAFPYCVGVKLVEVKQVNRKWSRGRNFCRPFRITFAVTSRTPHFIFTYPLYFCVGSFSTSARRCDTWTRNPGYCIGRCWSCDADNMSYLRVTAEVRLH